MMRGRRWVWIVVVVVLGVVAGVVAVGAGELWRVYVPLVERGEAREMVVVTPPWRPVTPGVE